MLPCSAFQKLERYGQFGQLRSLDSFLQTSLKDPKQSNLYALTHVGSWKEAAEALHASHGTAALPVFVSDTLISAAAYAVGLIHAELSSQPKEKVAGGETVRNDAAAVPPPIPPPEKALQLIPAVASFVAGLHRNAVSDGTALTEAMGLLVATSCELLLALLDETGYDAKNCGGSSNDKTATWLPAVALALPRAPTFSEKQLRREANCALRGSCMDLVTGGLQQWLWIYARVPVPKLFGRPADNNPSAVAGSHLHRLSLLMAHMPPPAATTPSTSSSLRRRVVALRSAVIAFLAPVVGSKGAHAYVYLGGDETQLARHRASALDYALVSRAAECPTSAALKATFSPASESSHNGAVNTPNHKPSGPSVAFVNWLLCMPVVFEAFCSQGTWRRYYREKRRDVLGRQALEWQANSSIGAVKRRALAKRKRQDQRASSAKRTRHEASSNSDAGSTVGGATDKDETESGSGQHLAREGVEDDDSGSAISAATSTAGSLAVSLRALSQGGSAALLPLLSDSASQQGGAASLFGEGSGLSYDGNTHLPVALLQLLVTSAVQSFFPKGAAAPLLEASTSGIAKGQLPMLRAMAWTTIEELFRIFDAAVAAGTSAAGTSVGASGLFFTVHDDLRFNGGLGLRALTTLFTTVVLPAMAVSQTTSADGPEGRSANAALAQCLVNFERIAPSIITAHLPMVLRAIFSIPLANPTSGAPTVAHTFALRLVARLGDTNQLKDLIAAAADLLTGHEQAATDTTDSAQDGIVKNLAEALSDAASLFSQAITNAAKATIDSDSLMGAAKSAAAKGLRFSPTKDLTDEEALDEAATLGTSTIAVHAAVALVNLATAVVAGVAPTTVTSMPLAESCCELDLLVSLSIKELAAVTLPGNERDAKEASGFAALYKPRHAARLTRAAIRFLYAVRALCDRCLDDLATEAVDLMLRALEETVWQFTTNFSHVAGLLGCDEAVTACGGTMPIETGEQSDDLSVVEQESMTLITQLAVQRCSLGARIVTVLNDEGTHVIPKDQRKAVVRFIQRCGRRLPSVYSLISPRGWLALLMCQRPVSLAVAAEALGANAASLRSKELSDRLDAVPVLQTLLTDLLATAADEWRASLAPNNGKEDEDQPTLLVLTWIKIIHHVVLDNGAVPNPSRIAALLRSIDYDASETACGLRLRSAVRFLLADLFRVAISGRLLTQNFGDLFSSTEANETFAAKEAAVRLYVEHLTRTAAPTGALGEQSLLAATAALTETIVRAITRPGTFCAEGGSHVMISVLQLLPSLIRRQVRRVLRGTGASDDKAGRDSSNLDGVGSECPPLLPAVLLATRVFSLPRLVEPSHAACMEPIRGAAIAVTEALCSALVAIIDALRPNSPAALSDAVSALLQALTGALNHLALRKSARRRLVRRAEKRPRVENDPLLKEGDSSEAEAETDCRVTRKAETMEVVVGNEVASIHDAEFATAETADRVLGYCCTILGGTEATIERVLSLGGAAAAIFLWSFAAAASVVPQWSATSVDVVSVFGRAGVAAHLVDRLSQLRGSNLVDDATGTGLRYLMKNLHRVLALHTLVPEAVAFGTSTIGAVLAKSAELCAHGIAPVSDERDGVLLYIDACGALLAATGIPHLPFSALRALYRRAVGDAAAHSTPLALEATLSLVRHPTVAVHHSLGGIVLPLLQHVLRVLFLDSDSSAVVPLARRPTQIGFVHTLNVVQRVYHHVVRTVATLTALLSNRLLGPRLHLLPALVSTMTKATVAGLQKGLLSGTQANAYTEFVFALARRDVGKQANRRCFASTDTRDPLYFVQAPTAVLCASLLSAAMTAASDHMDILAQYSQDFDQCWLEWAKTLRITDNALHSTTMSTPEGNKDDRKDEEEIASKILEHRTRDSTDETQAKRERAQAAMQRVAAALRRDVSLVEICHAAMPRREAKGLLARASMHLAEADAHNEAEAQL